MVMEVVLDRHIDQQPDMDVRYSIEDLSPLFPGPNQTGKAELAKLVARRRLARVDHPSDFADAEFPALEESVHHTQPPRIGEKLESIGKLLSIIGAQDRVRDFSVSVRVFGLWRHVPNI